jgi:hypothetical protein
MNNISSIINLVETILYIALPVFILSTLYLINIVKKNNYKMIKNSVTNPYFPNIDLSFFNKLQKEYLLIKTNKIPAAINKISFYFTVLGFIILLLLVIFQEMTRY